MAYGKGTFATAVCYCTNGVVHADGLSSSCAAFYLSHRYGARADTVAFLLLSLTSSFALSSDGHNGGDGACLHCPARLPTAETAGTFSRRTWPGSPQAPRRAAAAPCSPSSSSSWCVAVASFLPFLATVLVLRIHVPPLPPTAPASLSIHSSPDLAPAQYSILHIAVTPFLHRIPRHTQSPHLTSPHPTPHRAVPCRAVPRQVWYAIAYVGKYADELGGEAPVATPAVPAPDDAYIDAFSRYV